MAAVIYGIKNCDTMKKAFDWLREHDIAYEFRDYRMDPVDADTVRGWCRAIGWEKVLNKASTTFRQLPEAEKAGLDEAKAVALMTREPTMIKRPVLVLGDSVTNGFKPDVYGMLFKKD